MPERLHRRIGSSCPLCAEVLGRTAITAEFEFSSPVLTIADLSGGGNAAVFGVIGVVKPDQEQHLSDAALVAHDVWRVEASVDGRGKGG